MSAFAGTFSRFFRPQLPIGRLLMLFRVVIFLLCCSVFVFFAGSFFLVCPIRLFRWLSVCPLVGFSCASCLRVCSWLWCAVVPSFVPFALFAVFVCLFGAQFEFSAAFPCFLFSSFFLVFFFGVFLPECWLLLSVSFPSLGGLFFFSFYLVLFVHSSVFFLLAVFLTSLVVWFLSVLFVAFFFFWFLLDFWSSYCPVVRMASVIVYPVNP